MGEIVFSYVAMEETIANALWLSIAVGAVCGVIGFMIITRGIRKGLAHYKDVEAIFKRLQIFIHRTRQVGFFGLR